MVSFRVAGTRTASTGDQVPGSAARRHGRRHKALQTSGRPELHQGLPGTQGHHGRRIRSPRGWHDRVSKGHGPRLLDLFFQVANG